MAHDASRPPAPFVGRGPNGQITEDEARALLDELGRSGLTLRDFTLARGIKPQRLSWWKSKLAGKHPRRPSRPSRAKAARSAPPPRFVPLVVDRPPPTVAVEAAPAPRGAYEVALGEALTLRIPHDFHDATLARIVRVLREAR